MHKLHPVIYRETLAVGGISLALRGTGVHLGNRHLRRPKWFQKLYPFHEDSDYVLGFEIGQWVSGFYSERTESHSHPVATVLVYRYANYKKLL